jgi:ATP adenylyltransferase
MERGTLWQRVRTTTEHALRTGALLQFPTSIHYEEEGSVRYFVRVLEALKRKDEARREQRSASAGGEKFDPFLPPEQDLVVGDISRDHIAVLNKYNVQENHLLIVTRHFEDQEMLLTLRDFEALWFCLSEYDSLGFYNGGSEAGASQQHKHLQVVPLPLTPDGPAVPLAPLFAAAGADRVPALPFLHGFRRLEKGLALAPAEAARRTWYCYRDLLAQVGMGQPVPGQLVRQSKPYCLLVTREWVLLVPRSREYFDGISLNALAYAGSFFVRDQAQLLRLRSAGMMNALTGTALQAP